MPRETVTIAVSKLAPYEAAAQLLSVVAYPDNSKREREQFADAICGWVLRQSWEDQALSSNPMTAPPQYWKAAHDGIAVFDKGMLVLNRKRWIAAKQASQVVAAFLGEPVADPARPTSEEVITAISRDLRQSKRRETRGHRKGEQDTVSTKDNVSRRIWKPSRPVLHLGVAVHLTIHHLSPNRQDLNLGDLMHTTTIGGIIRIAGTIAPAMQDCFGIPLGELIEVVAA